MGRGKAKAKPLQMIYVSQTLFESVLLYWLSFMVNDYLLFNKHLSNFQIITGNTYTSQIFFV